MIFGFDLLSLQDRAKTVTKKLKFLYDYPESKRKQEIQDSQRRGMRNVILLLDELSNKLSMALGIGGMYVNYIKSMPPISRSKLPEYENFNLMMDVINPELKISAATVLLSKLTPHILERIYFAISLHPELFDDVMIDSDIEDYALGSECFDEEEEEE